MRGALNKELGIKMVDGILACSDRIQNIEEVRDSKFQQSVLESIQAHFENQPIVMAQLFAGL